MEENKEKEKEKPKEEKKEDSPTNKPADQPKNQPKETPKEKDSDSGNTVKDSARVEKTPEEKPAEASGIEEKQSSEESKPEDGVKDEAKTEQPSAETPTHPVEVLVLCGTDETLNKKLIDVLGECKVPPIMLQDKENNIKTLSQKRQTYEKIPFMLISLSADNLFYPKNSKPANALLCSDQELAFEIGFWSGLLGRENVFILYKEKKNFRLPSRFFDAFYCVYDYEGRWISVLEEKLKAHDYKINDAWDRHRQ